jgi:CRISPR-associated protein Csx10
MKINVKLTNNGFLLPGAGEGSALIDADPVITKEGFPYFPARTFKGLLKEALVEVLEIQGKQEDVDGICEELFGKPNRPGKTLLRFHNLYLQEHVQAKDALPAYKFHHPRALDPGRVTAHYTWEVAQTAIADDGVAKDRSLRNFRAVRPKQVFIGDIEFDEEAVLKHRDLLIQAATQLRYAGTKRNRGFGKVRVELDVPEKMESQSSETNDLVKQENPEGLRVTLTTNSATVLSAITGDRNTVSSDSFVRGSRIRGLIAEYLVKALGLGQDAHDDDLFREAILSGKLHFGPAYPGDSLPVPLNIHKIKGRAEEDLLDVFHEELLVDEAGKTRNTRTVGGLGKLENNQLHKTRTAISARFHNSRPNRTAGRSMENDEEGGIFYYEGVDAGQSFTGKITGDKDTLKKLFKKLPKNWEMRIGKSKATQYGSVTIAIKPIAIRESAPDLKGATKVLLHFRSPVALYNKNGFAVCNSEVLKDYLLNVGIEAEILKSAVKIGAAETWNRQWSSRSGRFPVYQEGSVFLLEVSKADQSAWEKLVRGGLGELHEQGYGQVMVQAWSDFPERISMPKVEDNPPEGEAKGCTILDELVDGYAKNQQDNAIRLYALDSVKDHELIPNHLLSRLEQKLASLVAEEGNTMVMVEAFRKWLKELKERPAGDTLKKKKLYEPLHDFFYRLPANVRPSQATGNEESIRLAMIAWKAVFKTIRHRNKKRTTHGN